MKNREFKSGQGDAEDAFKKYWEDNHPLMVNHGTIKKYFMDGYRYAYLSISDEDIEDLWHESTGVYSAMGKHLFKTAIKNLIHKKT